MAVSSIVHEDLDKLLSIPKLVIKTGLYQIKLDLERKEELLSVMYRVQDFGQDWASPAWVKLCGVSNQGDPLVNVVWMEEGRKYSLHRELMEARLTIKD